MAGILHGWAAGRRLCRSSEESTQHVTPTIVLYEVYKVIKRQRNEEKALAAADTSLLHHLAMADAIVFATALAEGATLIISDSDLAPLPGVTYLKKS